MKKFVNRFSQLANLLEIEAGDIIHCKGYHFESTGETRDKYFIVIYVDKKEDYIYAYFATSKLYHYNFCVQTQCYLRVAKPCYFLKDSGGFGFFTKSTVIQFHNSPDINHSSLLEAIKNEKMIRAARATDMDLFNLLNCVKNQTNIMNYHKNKIAPKLDELRVKLYPN